MANSRLAKGQLKRNGNRPAQANARRTAEQARRSGRAAADVTAEALRAGAGLFQRNGETLQHAWESGTWMINQFTNQSMKQFANAFGIPTERAGDAVEQSTRHVESIAQSGTIVAAGIQTLCHEMMDLARRRVELSVQGMDALTQCRTPQDVVQAQTTFIRDSLQDMMQSTRRLVETSMQMADDAVRKMNHASMAPR